MSKAKRTAILLIAILFLVTSVAFSIMVILQLREDSSSRGGDEAPSSLEAQRSLEDVLKEQQANENPQEDTAMLKGTKLDNFEPQGEASELKVIDLKEGDGAVVTGSATVTAHYTGAYAVNGEIFESSFDSGNPATFPLSGVIQGWQEGVPGMKVGGTRRLIIPGALAYGDAPEGYNPGDGGRPLGTLVFDITLVSVDQ